MTAFFYRNLKRPYPVIDSADGVWIKDTEGNFYLDGSSGAIVTNLGHGLTEISDAIKEQLERVSFAHTSQFVSQAGLDLATELINLAPENFKAGGRVYFVSGGSEAVETAIKMARSYFVEREEPKRNLVISRWNSYHGSTFGAMSVTGHPARRKPYYPMLKDQPHINAVFPYRCPCGFGPGACESELCAIARANELESAILHVGAENVMAFIAEPVVGAALGAAAPAQGYFERIREICSKYGILFIADEVMTGLGRCGANFAIDLWEVQPDIIVAGKGLSAGYMPLGAVIASAEVVSAFEEGSGVFEHGFTYSGHPLACSAGLAAVRYLQSQQLVESVKNRQAEFFARLNELRKFDAVGDVRGRGFLAGIELVADRVSKKPFSADLKLSQQLAREAIKNGLLIYPGAGFIDGRKGDHVMVAPPFTITDQEMDDLFKRLTVSLESFSKHLAVFK